MLYPTRTPITNAEIAAHAGMICTETTHTEQNRAMVSGRGPGRAETKVRTMAEIMREHGEGCTERDLIRKGFSQTDIELYGEKASARAAKLAAIN